MPRSQGQGSGIGGGMGGGAGRSGGGGAGRGGMGGKMRVGPGGNCVCPKCGEKVVHQQGVPCYSVNCSKCGATMMRE